MAKFIHLELKEIVDVYKYREDLVDGWEYESKLPGFLEKKELVSSYNKMNFRPVWMPMQKCYPYVISRFQTRLFIRKNNKICVDSRGDKHLVTDYDLKKYYKEV